MLARGSGVVAEEVPEVLVVFELLRDARFLCAGADACLVADGCVGEGFAGFGVDEVAGGGVEVEAGAEVLFEEGSEGGLQRQPSPMTVSMAKWVGIFVEVRLVEVCATGFFPLR